LESIGLFILSFLGNKAVVITGATGFVGKNVIQDLDSKE
jgi:FlaA1/EpsC-like NDP-sugar epimerase